MSAGPPTAVTSIGISTLIDELLLEQQQLTAVERFAQKHENATEPALAKHYRSLIPLSRPGEGEQYGFEVDLEACSGCKACVSACHSLNGLDESESWRDVGTLVGKGGDGSTQQTVTTACHHCADPACANGCPTLAYEKDSETGVVRHLDDQCMGCRYCELKCPYEVPKYNERLGIVRKCDMCQSRLAVGEAPACVQACPNEAIRITIVSESEILERSGSDDHLLPGTIESDYTRPSTRFVNLDHDDSLEPADADRVRPAHGHFPLAWMLALTQVGAGLFLGCFLWSFLAGEPVSRLGLFSALGISFAGLGGSILHLGRPTQAWRAFLGWRRSWLSREILVFGPWSGAMACFGASVFFGLPEWIQHGLGVAGSLFGLLGVFCSVMVYADTRRPFWSLPLVSLRFFGAMAGAAFLLSPWPWLALVFRFPVLAFDAGVFTGWIDRFPVSTRLFCGPLRRWNGLRLLGEFVFLVGLTFSGNAAGFLIAVAGMVFAEVVARSLFFQAVDEPRMPGAVKARESH